MSETRHATSSTLSAALAASFLVGLFLGIIKIATAPAAAPAGGAGAVKIEAGTAGKVFKVEASVGQAVKKGDAVVILEAMKMEIPVVAPEDGTVASIDVAVGDAIESGAVLATLN